MIPTLPRRLVTSGAALLLCTAGCAPPVPISIEAERTPSQAMAGLLAADRVFSSVTAGVDLGDGYLPMFAPDVVMPVPGRGFAVGRAQVIAALQGTAADAQGRLSWDPANGGISADGQHGYTYGYMSMRRPDSSFAAFRYLAYWVQQPEGWRIVAYRRVGSPTQGTRMIPEFGPAVPARMVAPIMDADRLSEFRTGLDRAERAFSARAQVAGLGPAFAEYGSANAAFLGDSTNADFIMGAEAIARDVSRGDPPGGSPVSWAPDRVLVASSDDLGLSIGTIRLNDATARSRPMPFFTVWRRAGVGAPWRYVAE